MEEEESKRGKRAVTPGPPRPWDRTVDFDMSPPPPWDPGFPGYTVSQRAQWVREHSPHPLRERFAEAVGAVFDGPPPHLRLTPAGDATLANPTKTRPYIITLYRLGDRPRLWGRLPFTVKVQGYPIAWLEERGSGELVATDHEGNPIRYRGPCVPWTLVSGIREMFAASVLHAAIALDGVFALPRYPECPPLRD